jgi:hypothetical protein
MENSTYIIEFTVLSEAEANRYAAELRDALRDASKEMQVEIKRTDPTAQDFGATLVLVLGTPAVVAAAKPAVVAAANTIGDWLKRRHSASINIKTEKGHFVGKNLTSKDAASLVEMFNKAK